jgi:hypothetical protein
MLEYELSVAQVEIENAAVKPITFISLGILTLGYTLFFSGGIDIS